jgi:hypothetical protein
VQYELWIHEGLKMREKILPRSKFQFKNWVFLNIRKILRLKGMVPAKNLRNYYLWWQCLKMQWTQETFGCIFRSIGNGYHAVISSYFKTVLMKHHVLRVSLSVIISYFLPTCMYSLCLIRCPL